MKADLVRITLLAASVVFGSLFLRETGLRYQLQDRINQLSDSCSITAGQEPTQPHKALPVAPVTNTSEKKAPSPAVDTTFLVDMRLKAIKKFINLSPEQETRLRDKYDSEMSGNDDVETEGLAEIVGPEQAKFYRDQRRLAFEKAENDEIEKEVLLFSSRLSLSSDEEDRLRIAMFETNREIAEWEKSQPKLQSFSRREMLNRYLKRYQLYRETLMSKTKTALPEEKYLRLIEEEAKSSMADLEIWHEPEEESVSDPVSQ